MLKKRIIPCLDIKEGRAVKGINFLNLKNAGDPIELAKKYIRDGADELVFLDITATNEKKKTILNLVEKIAKEINIPFTVGGGINFLEDAKDIISAGADKISINTSAVLKPKLISEIFNHFGSQCVVVAIDTKFENSKWKVFTNGGKVETQFETSKWDAEVEKYGAGEILLTSMNNDGMKNGFAIDIIKEVSEAINIPVIASGGAGNELHFKYVFQQTKVSGALAASVFHFGEINIKELKNYLKSENILIR